MEGDKFETWLGSIVGPEEQYYLVAKNDQELDSVIRKAAKIAYEKNIAGALVMAADQFEAPRELLDLEDFRNQPDKYFVVDIRNATEFHSGKFFDHAVNIPLHELREKAHQITTEKPIVVHCAGGYRSAAGYSILSAALPENKVYDLSEAVEEYVEKSEVLNLKSEI
jgi:rhodanese-related sulfurtransferase